MNEKNLFITEILREGATGNEVAYKLWFDGSVSSVVDRCR